MIKRGSVVVCVNAMDKRLHLSVGMDYRVNAVIGSMVSVSDRLGQINAMFQASRFELSPSQDAKPFG